MKFKDLLLVLLITGIWGLNYVFAKVGLVSFPPIFFCALKFVLSSCGLAFYRAKTSISWQTLFKLGIVFGVIEFSLLYLGIQMGVPAGIASLLMQAQIAFTLILSTLILKDKASWLEILGISIAAIGVIGISNAQSSVSLNSLGVVLILGAALAGGMSNIILKQTGKTDMLHLIAKMSLIPPIPLLLISYYFEEGQLASLQNINLIEAVSIFFSGVLSTFVGYGLWGRLLKIYSPSKVAPFMLLIPIFGLVGSFFILGEVLTLYQLLSVAVVLFGLLLTINAKRFTIQARPLPKPAKEILA